MIIKTSFEETQKKLAREMKFNNINAVIVVKNFNQKRTRKTKESSF